MIGRLLPIDNPATWTPRNGMLTPFTISFVIWSEMMMKKLKLRIRMRLPGNDEYYFERRSLHCKHCWACGTASNRSFNVCSANCVSQNNIHHYPVVSCEFST